MLTVCPPAPPPHTEPAMTYDAAVVAVERRALGWNMLLLLLLAAVDDLPNRPERVLDDDDDALLRLMFCTRLRRLLVSNLKLGRRFTTAPMPPGATPAAGDETTIVPAICDLLFVGSSKEAACRTSAQSMVEDVDEGWC